MTFVPEQGEWPCQFEPEVLPPPRLTAALYRLLRDHVQPGDVEQVLIDVRGAHYSEIEYTNTHLRDLAFSHAGYLMERSA